MRAAPSAPAHPLRPPRRTREPYGPVLRLHRARPRGVRLWHAPGDQEVPFPAAEATAALLPAARLTEQEAPDHIPSETTLRELFAEVREAAH